MKQCDECNSPFHSDSSEMDGLCTECAHHLYGYDLCDHYFSQGSCTKCGWNGSRSKHLLSLLPPLKIGDYVRHLATNEAGIVVNVWDDDGFLDCYVALPSTVTVSQRKDLLFGPTFYIIMQLAYTVLR